jgi:hypothetical protein
VPGEVEANPHLKVPALLAGMIAGADSIDDIDLLRHGGTKTAIYRYPGPLDAGHLVAYVQLPDDDASAAVWKEPSVETRLPDVFGAMCAIRLLASYFVAAARW